MAQQRADVSVPPGPAESYSSSGQAGGGTGSVFGALGGRGRAAQLDGPEIPALPVGTDPGGQGGYR